MFHRYSSLFPSFLHHEQALDPPFEDGEPDILQAEALELRAEREWEKGWNNHESKAHS